MVDRPDFAQRVLQDILRRRLIAPGERVLAAVSGGADSVCLLRTLLELAPAGGWEVCAAHFDHGMRPDSGEDSRFVSGLCERLRVPLFAGRSGSLGPQASEAEAREERLAFLRGAAREAGCGVIATGHTADDRAETVLLNLLRGTGLRGLRGIAWRSEPFVRPLLGMSRQEVRDRLRELGQEWREDASNRDLRFLRNRLRHSVLPMLEREVSPAVRRSLLRLAAMAEDEEELLERMARDLLERAARSPLQEGRFSLHAAALREAHPALARRAARLGLEALTGGVRDITFEMCERVLTAAARPSPGEDIGLGVHLRSDGRAVILSRTRPCDEPEPFDVELPRRGEVSPGSCGWTVRTADPDDAGDEPLRLLLRAGGRALRARSWRPGDRMRPKGLGAAKKLQDIFTDRRVPREERRSIPLICAGEEILWAPGVALSESAGHPGADTLVAVRPPGGRLPDWARGR